MAATQLDQMARPSCVGSRLRDIAISADHEVAFRVAVLASSEILRLGLEAMLHRLPQAELVASADSPDALGPRAVEQCDVLVVGLDGPLPPSLPPQPRRGPRVLVALWDVGEDQSAPWERLPVDGIVAVRSLRAEQLGQSLRDCVAGDFPVPAALVRALLTQSATTGGQADRPAPTGREHEALALLAKGLSNQQIARRLGISSHGAKRLVASVLLKLGATNRTAAVVQAMRQGLVPCPSAQCAAQTGRLTTTSH